MDLMGKFEGYNVYKVGNLASAAHEDDCLYVTPTGNMYLWRVHVGVVDMTTNRVMDFVVPEHIQKNVDELRAARKKRAEEKEKAKKETEVEKEAEVKVKETTTDDFFERIDAEINALLDSVKSEERKKETFSYEFN